jgi:hypothetical protein
MTLDEIYTGVTQPKKTSRAMGPMFKNWIISNPFGNTFKIKYRYEDFLAEPKAILCGGDDFLKKFCEQYLSVIF